MISHPTNQDVAQKVQAALRHAHEAGKRARVHPEAIVRELSDHGRKTWWYVPVEIAPYENELGTFYEVFSRAEDLLEAENIDVLLVPIKIETPAGEMAGK